MKYFMLTKEEIKNLPIEIGKLYDQMLETGNDAVAMNISTHKIFSCLWGFAFEDLSEDEFIVNSLLAEEPRNKKEAFIVESLRSIEEKIGGFLNNEEMYETFHTCVLLEESIKKLLI